MIKKMLKVSKNLVVIYYEDRDTQELICNDGRAVEKAIDFEKRIKSALQMREKCGKVIIKAG